VRVRRAQDVVALDLRRQRNRAAHDGAGALRGVHDLHRRLVDQLVIERFQADANSLVLHCFTFCTTGRPFARFFVALVTREAPGRPKLLVLTSAVPAKSRVSLFADVHSMILATTPAPTVRPPSRMAKRKPSSIAIGAINVTVIPMLSPGITISVPSGSTQLPVTSVVRK